jgi:chromosome segregation ATPase
MRASADDIMAMSRRVASLQAELSDTRGRLVKQEDEQAANDDALGKMLARVADVEARLRAQQKRAAEAEERAQESEDRVEELAAEVQRLRSEAARGAPDTPRSGAEPPDVARLREELAGATRRIEAERRGAEEAARDREREREQAGSLRTKLADLEIFQVEVEELRGTVVSLETDLARVRRDLEKERVTSREMERRLVEQRLEGERSRAEMNEIGSLRDEFEEAQEELVSRRSEIERLTRQVAALSAERNQTKRDLEGAEERLAEKAQELAQALSEVARIRRDLTEVNDLRKALTAAHDDLAALRAEVEASRADAGGRERRLADLRRETDTLRAQLGELHDLRRRAAELGERLATAEVHQKAATAAAEDERRAAASRADEIAHTHQELEKATSRAALLKADLEVTAKDLEVARAARREAERLLDLERQQRQTLVSAVKAELEQARGEAHHALESERKSHEIEVAAARSARIAAERKLEERDGAARATLEAHDRAVAALVEGHDRKAAELEARGRAARAEADAIAAKLLATQHEREALAARLGELRQEIRDAHGLRRADAERAHQAALAAARAAQAFEEREHEAARQRAEAIASMRAALERLSEGSARANDAANGAGEPNGDGEWMVVTDDLLEAPTQPATAHASADAARAPTPAR